MRPRYDIPIEPVLESLPPVPLHCRRAEGHGQRAPWIPLQNPKKPTAARSRRDHTVTSKKAPEAPHQAKRRRILIVDDSSTHRLWLELMLGSRYDIDVAVDGEAGLRAAAANKPDLILLDVVMPGADGFTTCRALRKRTETRKTPVIMVTTKDEEIDVETGYTSGCTDYIAKPVDQLELLAKVESWLDASGVV